MAFLSLAVWVSALVLPPDVYLARGLQMYEAGLVVPITVQTDPCSGHGPNICGDYVPPLLNGKCYPLIYAGLSPEQRERVFLHALGHCGGWRH